MRVAVISDVHANLPALRAVLDDIAALGCDAVWCTGDVVGRGPHPNEVVDLLASLEIPCVQGNWDEAVGMGRELAGSLWATPGAEVMGAASLAWTIETTGEAQRAWLRALPATERLSVEGRSVLLFHGSPIKQNEYLWADRPSRYFARIAADEGDDLFCFGHTHEGFHRVMGQGHFVAAGSVGCGTAGDQRARYAIVHLAPEELVVGFRSVAYDRSQVDRDLRRAGLAPELLRLHPVPHPRVADGTAPLPEAPAEPASA